MTLPPFRTPSALSALAVVIAASVAGCGREGADSAALAPKTAIETDAAPARSMNSDEVTTNCLPLTVAEFGDVPLGASFSAFPDSVRRERKIGCPDDCSFTGSDGVEYVIFEDYVSWKRLRVGRWRAEAPLGLTAHTDLRAAQTVLARHGVKEEPFTPEGDTLPMLGVSVCGDRLTSFNLSFDAEGRLQEVGLMAKVI